MTAGQKAYEAACARHPAYLKPRKPWNKLDVESKASWQQMARNGVNVSRYRDLRSEEQGDKIAMYRAEY